MFAVTYSTQAILPDSGRAFDVSPAEAGLSISVVVLALAVGAWIWGPFSDRVGRKRSIVLASTLLVPPTIGAALAPSFALLLVFRTLQGLCMPGLLTAGVPYVAEAFVPTLGARAMGYYVSSLVAGGLIGRVGVALLADAIGRVAERVGWQRLGLGAIALAAVGLALSLPASLPSLVVGLALVTLANFSGVTAAQLGVTRATAVDRGAASAVYFSLYYGIGSLGAYVPGLAWERFGWNGVAVTAFAALGIAAAFLSLTGALRNG